MEISTTARGFPVCRFTDSKGTKCNMQISSVIAEESHVWLGVAEDKIQVMTPGKGWQEIDLATLGECVLITNRMHLSQSQVKDLLPLLQHFAETGELPQHE